MKKIIFEKLTIKEKKKILAGINEAGNPLESGCFSDSFNLDGDSCCGNPIIPDSECIQGKV